MSVKKERVEIEKEVNVYCCGTYDFNSVKVVKKRVGAEEDLYTLYSGCRQSLVTVEPPN